MSISFHRVEDLAADSQIRVQIADAIVGADPLFFSTLRRVGLDVRVALDSLLDDCASDISTGWVAVINDRIAGLVSFAHARDIKAKQLRSLSEYLRRIGDRQRFAAAMRDFAARKQPTVDDSVYLLRIFIAEGQRGKGLSVDLMSMFIEAARASPSRCCSLHVHRDNSSARGLYEKLSFSFLADADRFEYQAMVRKLG